jgi:hypothetical protein
VGVFVGVRVMDGSFGSEVECGNIGTSPVYIP